ncbi:MAG TPA: cytochrome c oxidase assembly protein [Novosphingobium sp.]|nr:cytochrome c oxidase assembly protein [Novosphingobium sp.]
MTATTLHRSNRKVGTIALLGALAMLGMGYAAVPLYRMFCQATGLGGTTQRASEAQASAVQVAAKTISIRFDGNVASGMPWTFGPEQVTQQVRIGQRSLAFFKARNDSDKPVTGIASFNVEPERAGIYFNKIHCFCFNQQTLQPGQQVDMPVQYYVDPAILKDAEAQGIEQITLSYTFHKVPDQAVKGLDRANPSG